ncbi:class I SAM-dependent methyltransferase [Brevundimonas sp.]|uniref:class I SAM-dependent methyltransferase n=1 Tax=Brevundimonas sp. TaxID=1871086 RepID=UPI002737F492|nr:class I SAM-dependent methyltransferase [Brevundimonas sp.]MDP3802977.1 class I SAM-dependent methyltransferase [Brevundimonas sp.]
MDQSYRAIEICRLCGGKELTHYVDFGEVPLGNNLQESTEAARGAAAYPLVLNRCDACAHFQLGHAVAPELLYATNYTYLSGIGVSFVKHFAEYAEWAATRLDLAPGSLVVDIGSNDGTALKPFQAQGHRVFGVDPASLAASIANDNGVETLNAFFDEAAVDEILRRHGQADFVTSHNVLAHVDDLAAVFRNIHRLLKDGGWFAFEIGYFREVLRTGCFDTTYHEHLDYHHAAPLSRHLTALGFDVVDLSVNAVQGGSLRLLLRKSGEGRVSAAARAFLEEERGSVLYDAEFLAGWKAMIEATMAAFGDAVRLRRAAGKRLVAYGAPTKATLLLQMAHLTADEIAMVVDDNPHKVGRFLPGSAIPIRATAELDDDVPDVIVILAWNFADDICGKLRGRFPTPVEALTPLPDLRSVLL